MKKILLYLLCICGAMQIASAQLPLTLDQRYKDAIQNHTRTESGIPGDSYWQNFASYKISVAFTPDKRLVQGTEKILYSNNSPDTLKEIVLFLYPDFYKKGVYRNYDCAKKDEGKGVIIETAMVNDLSAKYYREGTRMIITNQMVLPHTQVNLKLDWHYTLNKGSHVRTGMVDNSSAFVAYFFPRVAVYDDIDGWNNHDYTGLQEFYNDFCNFDVKITVPQNQVVWATGNLLNQDSVFLPMISSRLEHCLYSNQILNVIDSADMKTFQVTQPYKFLTYHFTANGVTDFVFACSDHYLWQASGVEVDSTTHRMVRVDAAFNPIHKDYFEVAHDARLSVIHMSDHFPKVPFPFPHETVFDGLDQMEYPMMVNDNPETDHAESVELTDHEIMHSYFPFYMGINETQYAWMDEGWATIGEWIITPWIDSSLKDYYGVNRMAVTMQKHHDSPMITNSLKLDGEDYFANSYAKPGFMYWNLWSMLGDKVFFDCLHTYMNTWNGKHPVPMDFFNTFNQVSHKNLNWYFNDWFYKSNMSADLSIDSVKIKDGQARIYVSNKGGLPVPVVAEVKYKSGKTETYSVSAFIWEKQTSCVIFFSPAEAVDMIKLGTPRIPDGDQSNNFYTQQ